MILTNVNQDSRPRGSPGLRAPTSSRPHPAAGPQEESLIFVSMCIKYIKDTIASRRGLFSLYLPHLALQCLLQLKG